jgi:hypothetical protein
MTLRDFLSFLVTPEFWRHWITILVISLLVVPLLTYWTLFV